MSGPLEGNGDLMDMDGLGGQMVPGVLTVNGVAFPVEKLLGKGKGGYSYLARVGEKERTAAFAASCLPAVGQPVVVKQIHHEPCDYYQFGNKMEAEVRDYRRLREIGIRMPQLFLVDESAERIVKEYIDGPTVYELVQRDCLSDFLWEQVRGMCALLYPAGLNIDYFPTNFVVCHDRLYYIDYECNDYMDEWNFENLGIKYWSRTPEFLEYEAQKC